MNANLKKALRIYGAVTMAHQAIMFGAKFLCATKEEKTYDIGGYSVTTTCNPGIMGMNMVAQTNSVFFGHARVTTDGLFEIMPESIKKCVLAHELGHMVLDGGMPENMTAYAVSRQLGICPKAEKVADSMSTKLYGAKATKAMLKALAIVAPGPEIIQRILSVK